MIHSLLVSCHLFLLLHLIFVILIKTRIYKSPIHLYKDDAINKTVMIITNQHLYSRPYQTLCRRYIIDCINCIIVSTFTFFLSVFIIFTNSFCLAHSKIVILQFSVHNLAKYTSCSFPFSSCSLLRLLLFILLLPLLLYIFLYV